MFGNNPKRKSLFGDGNSLFVQEIFYTFQGEGPFAGYPSVFIRLGGCNLACSFCDTEFESFQEMNLDEILSKVGHLSGNRKVLVVITGGEPLRQPIEKICSELIKLGYKVQIETNGTLWREIDQKVSIICSPKNTGSKYRIPSALPIERVTAYKFLLSATNEKYQYLPDLAGISVPIYVQPIDEYDEQKNKMNLEYTMKFAAEHGYILSIQLHKMLGIN